jgi:HAD superfamily hydrolase (TIGR01459 family)
MTFKIELLAPIINRYDAFLIDQFGVLIDGEQTYPGAIDALKHIAQSGKPVVILSNSGKRAEPNCNRLTSFGFDRQHFVTVVTSGEIAYHSIKNQLGITIKNDARVMVLARPGETSPILDLDLTETNNPRMADILLIVSRDIGMNRKDYIKLWTEFNATGGKCYCLNPDLNMLTPKGITFSAGTIAKLFEQRGGDIIWYGKPYQDIYADALRFFNNIPRDDILCIGDSIHHDIIGGHAAGLATALVRKGVHSDISDGKVYNILSGLGISPTHILRSFSIT